MDKRIKKRWVAALRSRKYKQGKGYLKSDDKYCCLGVLCDLFSKSKAGRAIQAKFDNDGYFLDEDTLLPEKVKNWAKLDSMNPQISNFNNVCTNNFSHAAILNDIGTKFYEIARLIERNL